MGKITLLHIDCMTYMKGCEDNAFDLAIVDPPYFQKLGNPAGFYGKKEFSDTGIKRSKFKEFEKWDVPDENYFNELFRVSKNQIIWGVNYYADKIPHVGRIVWDKVNDSSSFSKAEIASKSMGIGVDMFRFMWNGMLQGDMKNKEIRIHPTQKPIHLYKWLFDKYAKPNQRILDTHLGSAPSAIAAHYFGCDFVGCELDKDYYNAAVNRFNEETKQVSLF